MAFMSPRASKNVLRAPSAEALAERSPAVSAEHIVKRMTHHSGPNGTPELCDLDAIVHVQVDDLDHTTFASLGGRGSDALQKRVLLTPYQIAFQEVDQETKTVSDTLKAAVLSFCSSVSGAPWRTSTDLGDTDADARTLYSVVASDLQASQSEIAAQLADLENAYPEHVVIVSAAAPGLARRSMEARQAQPGEPPRSAPFQPPAKFFERYQVFSTETVLSIGIAVFLLFFTTVGVSMISSTQVPDKLGSSSTNVTQEKKRQ
ncbi:hypothetical protein MVES_000589 [Malassezia vespertilionis]|uniref:Protein BIG1 n=2 Tax=Malassezia vespertilionis TaxID=2020962 RepID=A0A2N1JG57_9BASI|nr:hypothetical protein MVES_000589 [Malassezia vespertilionis]